MTEPLGSGRRFRALSAALAKNPKVKDPAALAASIGRKKFGKERANKLSQVAKAAPKPPPETRARASRIKV